MSSTPGRLWRGRALHFGFGAAAIAVTSIAGIARTKWFALHLDTEGIGVIGQVVATHTWLGALAGLGLGIPLARRIGKALGEADPAALRRAVWTACVIGSVSIVAGVVAGLLFAPAIALAVLGDPAYAVLVRIAMLGTAGYALNGILQGIYAGHSNVRPPFTIALAGGVASVTVALLLVPGVGLAGGVLSAALHFPAGIVAAVLVHRALLARAFAPAPRPAYDPGIARDLLAVGAAALLLALADQGALLGLRSHFLRQHGVGANGLFQAALAISQQVAAPFYAYLANYAFGRISGASGIEEARAYTRKLWTPILLLGFVAVAAAMVLASPLLHLLYSERFDPARPMMAWMLFGEFCRLAGLTWAVGALPFGGRRVWIAVGLAYPLPLIAAYPFTGPTMMSLPLAAACAGVATLAGSGLLMSRTGVTLRPRDLGLLAVAVATLWSMARALSA